MQKAIKLGVKHLSSWEPVTYLFPAKSFLGKKLYLNALFPLAGIWGFIQCPKITKQALYFSILPLLGTLLALFHQDWTSLARSVQFFSILLFFNFLLLKPQAIKKIFEFSGPAIVVYLIFSIAEGIITWQNPAYAQRFIMRISGIIGEPNYMGLVYTALFSISFIRRQYPLTCLSLLGLASTGSRGGIVSVAFILAAAVFFKVVRRANWRKVFVHTSVVFFVSYPLLIGGIKSVTTEEQFQRYSKLTSERFSLQYGFYDLAKQNIFGLGYFRGWNAIKGKESQYKLSQSNEQHNIFVQALSELGVAGYLAVIALFFYFAHKALSLGGDNVLFLFTALLSGTFLNCFHEFFFYLCLGAALSNPQLRKRDDLEGNKFFV